MTESTGRPRSFGIGAAVRAVHRRLLPDEDHVGWIPYLWLAYLVIFVLDAFWGAKPPLARAAALAGLLVFLALYFHGYWVRGRRIVPIILAITALGAALAPFIRGSGVFFVFAAAFCARVGPPRAAAKLLAAQVLVVVALGLLLPLPREAWIMGSAMGLMIGVVNIYYFEMGRKDQALKVSQEEVRRLGAMAERERIGRDLHDLLGHTLSVITIKAELASKLLTRDPDRAALEIKDVERISRDALAEVRAAVAGYRSGGFRAELANARLALEAVDVALTFEGELASSPPESEAVLSMVLREAVTNIIRPARATRCLVRLEEEAGTVRLVVEDDGRGGVFVEGSGLSGMRERVRGLGGSLTVTAQQGTRVVVELMSSGERRGVA